ncbi:unnamed protein product [Kuraishia capsulata CBS 1993]|uniref:Uncharacterized protein n=1 Tax=Kuraishia capsulata CBS 1993 TaxID=1382522 RepID=W6MHU1_9ASCO|nr:uncharacterized protein KUCA_T00001551001 [Kuraishia capsulata CBS 1993]CDK25581.1 unnamed protein product [Kuraishia capsulata CBS 1993]
MGYSSPIGGQSRKVVDSLLWIHSAPFSRFRFVSFGARMSVMKASADSKNYVVFAAIPYDEEMIGKLTSVIGDSDWFKNITHLIIPDTEHTMAVLGYKERLPNVKIVGMESCNEKIDPLIDFKFGAQTANKAYDSAEQLKDVFPKMDEKDSELFDSFGFCYIPGHPNKELTVFQKSTGSLVVGDLLFNMQSSGKKFPFTDYSQEAYGGKDPTGFISSKLTYNGFLVKKLAGATLSGPQAAVGIQEIYKWNFSRIIMCHGDLIERSAKDIFKEIFAPAF